MYHFLVQRKYVNSVLILRMYLLFSSSLKNCIQPVNGYRLYVR
ncbi:rCG61830 [Rattus norvegicus]|uniref:RCG61830 n=1 Tax=Rattus norvegicus TaxID=10116 RepID=A6HC46_RAT|nr:rCG61830 [Rattus norvegicus]